eukprot:1321699-Amphidinium_carterae.1
MLTSVTSCSLHGLLTALCQQPCNASSSGHAQSSVPRQGCHQDFLHVGGLAEERTYAAQMICIGMTTLPHANRSS